MKMSWNIRKWLIQQISSMNKTLSVTVTELGYTSNPIAHRIATSPVTLPSSLLISVEISNFLR